MNQDETPVIAQISADGTSFIFDVVAFRQRLLQGRGKEVLKLAFNQIRAIIHDITYQGRFLIKLEKRSN